MARTGTLPRGTAHALGRGASAGLPQNAVSSNTRLMLGQIYRHLVRGVGRVPEDFVETARLAPGQLCRATSTLL